MKKNLLIGTSTLIILGTIYATYLLTTPKIYKDNEIKCDFDAGICYDLKDKPITGRIQSYHNNILISDIEYKNGKENGLLKIYRNTGNIYLEGTYKDGKPDGYVKEYTDDGKLFSYDEFKNGLQHGTSIIYQNNGKILKQWHYNQGNETKNGYVYYTNGNIQLEINHTNQEIKHYYENGKLRTLAHFNNKGYNGTWTNYNQEGQIIAELTYDNGVPQKGYCLDDSSRIEFNAEDFKVFASTNKTPCDIAKNTTDSIDKK